MSSPYTLKLTRYGWIGIVMHQLLQEPGEITPIEKLKVYVADGEGGHWEVCRDGLFFVSQEECVLIYPYVVD